MALVRHDDTEQEYDDDESFICDICVNVTDYRDGDGTYCADCAEEWCEECGSPLEDCECP